jgi:hypothetical protein
MFDVVAPDEDQLAAAIDRQRVNDCEPWHATATDPTELRWRKTAQQPPAKGEQG